MPISLPFAILRPVNQPPRLDKITHLGAVEDLTVLDEIVRGWNGKDVMALDFETRGDVDEEDSRVVTVALSDSRGSVTVEFREGNPWAYPYLMGALLKAKIPIVAHNAYFDASWPLRDLCLDGAGDAWYRPEVWERYNTGAGKTAALSGGTPFYIPMLCSYATYRHLANEGWEGQRYGLAAAQLELLGWEESNKDAVAVWLSQNGCVKKNVPKVLRDRDPETFSDEEMKSYLSCADKGQLWKVPYEVLAPYNALDADSTWLLWTHVLAPRLAEFKELQAWMLTTYPAYTKIMIEQKLRGIALDMEFLPRYEEALRNKADSLVEEFLSHPEIKPHVDTWELGKLKEYADKEPSRYAQSTELGPEPPRFTKTGSETKRWKNWSTKKAIQDRDGRPLSGNWVDWNRKMTELSETRQFSLTSPLAMTWLLYEKLGLEVRVKTDSGLPSTAIDAISHAPGVEILQLWSTLNKEHTTVESLLGIQRSGIYHNKVRMPGTHTGRLSGSGGFNCQNVSKSPMLRAFAARPGFKILVADITALENMVVTELSGDPNLMKLYGPDADPNVDAHLTNGANWAVIGPKIRATGFDPDHPTPESVAKAKKECKAERDIAKTTAYSLIYGAGAPRLQAALAEENIHLPIEDCEAIREAYWTTYVGVQDWYKELKRQWRMNRGWFLNGLGHPCCVDREYLRDVGSRAVQSTGHSAFVLLLLKAAEVLTDKGINWHPWNADVHDALMFEVADEDCERAVALFPGIVQSWNELLGGEIKLKAEPAIVATWMDDKFNATEQIKLELKYGLKV